MVSSSSRAVLKTVTSSNLSGSLLTEFHILILAIIKQGANYLVSPAQWLNIAPEQGCNKGLLPVERDDISGAITLPIVGRPANDAGSHWCL